MDRDASYSLWEMKLLVEAFRKDIDPPAPRKTGGRGKKKDNVVVDTGEGSSTLPPPTQDDAFVDPDAPLPPKAFIESLGMKLDQLSVDSSHVIGRMHPTPRSYNNRVSEVYPFRIIATSGLEWNLDSQYRSRDYLMCALAAILETLFVKKYRKVLIKKCKGAAMLRRELHDYFLSIAKANHVDAPQKKSGNASKMKQIKMRQTTLNKPVSIKEWVFADMIKVDSNAVDVTEYDYKRLSAKLLDSHKHTDNRKADPIFRVVDTMMKCPYLACDQDSVPTGTIESAAYYLIQAFNKVRSSISSNVLLPIHRSRAYTSPTPTRPSIVRPTVAQLMHIQKARSEHKKKGTFANFNPDKVDIPDLVMRPHAESEELTELVSHVHDPNPDRQRSYLTLPHTSCTGSSAGTCPS
jgi:hypothetical protein